MLWLSPSEVACLGWREKRLFFLCAESDQFDGKRLEAFWMSAWTDKSDVLDRENQ